MRDTNVPQRVWWKIMCNQVVNIQTTYEVKY